MAKATAMQLQILLFIGLNHLAMCHRGGRPGHIDFELRPCLLASECSGLDLDASALSEFEICDPNGPKYFCPKEGSGRFCDCKSITDCPTSQKLIKERNFPALNQLHKELSCAGGDHLSFDGRLPTLCCPPSAVPKIVVPKLVPTTTVATNTTTTAKLPTVDDLLDELDMVCSQNILKISFGQATDDHEFPWMAALVYETPENDSEFIGCGGSIVSDNVIMTAAHCDVVTKSGHSLAKVRVGHADLSQSTTDVKIESINLHPGFGKTSVGSLINDIALLKLAEPLHFSNGIRPICLPRKNYTDAELGFLTVAGWGRTENGTSSDVLLQVDLNVVSSQACQVEYRSGKVDLDIRDSQICAQGDLTIGSDSCNGDSGGPLMLLSPRTGRHEAVGITSFGHPLCNSAVPGVYTRVSSFFEWIADFMLESSISK